MVCTDHAEHIIRCSSLATVDVHVICDRETVLSFDYTVNTNIISVSIPELLVFEVPALLLVDLYYITYLWGPDNEPSSSMKCWEIFE
jgi:hypothetical protein